MSTARKWLWIGLETLGGLSILCALLMAAAIAWCAWEMSPYCEKTNTLKPKDAQTLLEWGGIDKEARAKAFIYSKTSRRSFTGDHADFYVLQMEHFPQSAALQSGKWSAGPLTDPTLKKAVDFSMIWSETDYKDFPRNPGEQPFLFSFPWINLSGQRVTAAIVMFYNPETRRLYIVDSKT